MIMKKYIISLLSVFVSISMMAKTDIDPKYGEGTVPVDENGIVCFTQTIDIPSQLSEDECYNLLMSWAKGRFAKPYAHAGRILSENPDSHRFVFHVEQILTFKRTGIVADESEIKYNFSIAIGNDKITATMTDISYNYEEGREGGGQVFSAEEWITDNEAFNSKHTKFLRRTGKFRIKTIDLKDRLFEAASQYLTDNM